ncbi:hypothetical protein OG568_46090 [Streptomyces sp. NBC_01450]|uniref:hypothetical protein n=1 Tax=Streptomyces sp. NBC_01450 TaxID=2903871 RepID=UPI002E2FDE3E|nr:hypothetical protein [Streptomyces sp. NBC_01450]
MPGPRDCLPGPAAERNPHRRRVASASAFGTLAVTAVSRGSGMAEAAGAGQ